jgi:hypothetical protein
LDRVRKTLKVGREKMKERQASLAAKGDWEVFERLQGELKGGRRK